MIDCMSFPQAYRPASADCRHPERGRRHPLRGPPRCRYRKDKAAARKTEASRSGRGWDWPRPLTHRHCGFDTPCFPCRIRDRDRFAHTHSSCRPSARKLTGIDVQSLRKLLDRVCRRSRYPSATAALVPQPPGRTMPRPYFRTAAASAIRNAGMADLPVRQHLQRKLVIGDRFVDEAAPVAVDHQRPRFAAVEHEVRKHRLRSVPAPPDRCGRPECGAEIPVADARADLDALSCASPFEPGATEDQPASVPSAAGRRSAWRLKSATRQNQPAIDADLARDAVRCQNRHGRHAPVGIPDNLRKRRARQDIHIADAISEYSSRPTRALPITSRVPRPWLNLVARITRKRASWNAAAI